MVGRAQTFFRDRGEIEARHDCNVAVLEDLAALWVRHSRWNGRASEVIEMLKRLTLGFAVALMTAAPLMAAPTLPGQAAERIPTSLLPAWAAQALCTYLGFGC